ncbi:putative electron transfer flavoprotein subunit [Mortierella sp. GBA43]|nr:putative electron transfer flavoprotein subunit [Mortierella sp. GBA43]
MASSSKSSSSEHSYKQQPQYHHASGTFKSSHSTSPLPHLDSFGFVPDDFLSHHADDSDDDDDDDADVDQRSYGAHHQQGSDLDQDCRAGQHDPYVYSSQSTLSSTLFHTDANEVRRQVHPSDTNEAEGDRSSAEHEGCHGSGAPGAQVAEFGKLFHVAPSPWSEDTCKTENSAIAYSDYDEEDSLSQPLDSPSVTAIDQSPTTQGGTNNNGKESGSDTSNMMTTNPSKQQRGRGSTARRTIDRDNNSFRNTPPLCLQLDLQSLSALSLSSPLSTRFKSPEIAGQARLSDPSDNSQTRKENANEDSSVMNTTFLTGPTQTVDGSPIGLPRSSLGNSAGEQTTGDQRQLTARAMVADGLRGCKMGREGGGMRYGITFHKHQMEHIPSAIVGISTPLASTQQSAATASHLQLLLEQHHALQRKEQEAKEREKQLLQQSESQRHATSANLKADAANVAAYMAAYMKIAAAAVAVADRGCDETTIDPAKTSFSNDATTIAPSSTLLYPAPSSPTVSSSSFFKSKPANMTRVKSTKSHCKKPSMTSSDTAGAVGVDLTSEIMSTASGKPSQHRQECHNCGVTKTPLWRRTADRQHSLCNACGLYYKQYKTNRPLSGRPSKDAAITTSGADAAIHTPNALTLEQQAKRRKISDADTTVSIKNEQLDGSKKQPLKPLLPHPAARQEHALLPPSSISSSSSTPLTSFHSLHQVSSDIEADDDDEEREDMDDDLLDNSQYDVEMSEAAIDRASSDQEHSIGDAGDDDSSSSSSDDSDAEGQGIRGPRGMMAKQGTSKSELDSGLLSSSSSSSSSQQQQQPRSYGGSRNGICANCGQTQTPLWRKDAKGQSICNACGLYARLHQRDRPITMRKTKIARRKRDWSAVSKEKQLQVKEDIQERFAAESAEGHGNNANANAKKRKEVTLNEGCHVEHLPTPASNASLSPIMGSSALSSMALGNGSLSPSLTPSPPTPALTAPHFMNTASTFPGLNSLLLQQYQHQQLQNQAAFNAAAVAAAAAAVSAGTATVPTTAAEGLPLLSHNWLSPLYQYPASFLNSSTLPRDPMSLAGLHLQQQQQQQDQQQSPFQTRASSPMSPVSLSRQPSQSPRKLDPIITNAQTLQDLQKQQQQARQQQQQQQQEAGLCKKGQGPLILDSTRFTRLMNQMSKAQLSMFLTILEERCGALRHRLSGEDDQVERLDTNEMMMMINTPQFSSIEGGLSTTGSGSTTTTIPASSSLLATMESLGHDQERSDLMI